MLKKRKKSSESCFNFNYSKNCLNWNKTHALKRMPIKNTYQIKNSGSKNNGKLTDRN